MWEIDCKLEKECGCINNNIMKVMLSTTALSLESRNEKEKLLAVSFNYIDEYEVRKIAAYVFLVFPHLTHLSVK